VRTLVASIVRRFISAGTRPHIAEKVKKGNEMSKPLEHRGNRSTVLAETVRYVRVIPLIVVMASSSSAEPRTIKILSGTYGQNCGAPHGKATRDFASRCNGRDTCQYILHETFTTDSAARCRKDFRAEWLCTDTEFHFAELSAGARPGDTLVLSCVADTGEGK
jgi:hypothetical protein